MQLFIILVKVCLSIKEADTEWHALDFHFELKNRTWGNDF